jgi:hypothetical protein
MLHQLMMLAKRRHSQGVRGRSALFSFFVFYNKMELTT